MAMSVGPSSGEADVMVEMNTTPLIDVMLVLLIMLIVTIPVQTHAVKLDMPPPTPPKDEIVEPVVVELVVDFDGSVFWDGNPVPNTAVLEQYLKSAAVAENPPEIHLRPNRLVKYDFVAKVLAAAQRLGVKKIGFAGNEQYME